MRRLYRPDLPHLSAEYLRKKQTTVDAGSPVRDTWQMARPTKPMRLVEETLKGMAGKRGRCMYCEDSRGGEIDHFWPMARYKQKAFVWENLLWCCADCNRHKLDRFPLDESGAPLLIDPTIDDPWDFFVYETSTGALTPRFDVGIHDKNPRGRETVACIPALRDEAVEDGRQRTFRSLKKAVLAFLRTAADSDATPQDRVEARLDLLESIRDNDSYGLVSWCFRRDGQDDPPFKELREAHPDIWSEIAT